MTQKIKACVLVADAAKARCLWLLDDDTPGSERVTLEEEKQVWVHPLARVPEHERYQDSFTRGGNVGGSPGQTHTFDDHREEHDEDEKRRFAEEIAAAVTGLVAGRAVPRYVVCTSHPMAAHLRRAWERSEVAAAACDWVTAEVSGRSASELHAYLAERQLVPRAIAPRAQR